ncbi:MAG: hypothetical protein U0667_12040 [Chloroflexota bacterium]
MTTHRSSRLRLASVPAGLLLTVAVVGGTAAQSPVPTDGTQLASPAPSASAPAASLAPVIDVNAATQEEIAAAFVAAGIPNADRWAREVVEYRPYEADPTWARLRQELGKYNIDPAVLEQIIALLRV